MIGDHIFMEKTIEYLGVIPARGGSKGIPGKNIKNIAGQPLIAWTIKAAGNSKLLDDYIVSTDNADIAGIASNYGAKILPRPIELAQDESLIIDTLQHVIRKIPCKNVVMLQPTSPVRRRGLIDKCIRLHKSSNVDTVVTGFDCYYKEYKDTFVERRQDIKPFFYDDGNVYVLSRKMIEEGKIKSSSNKKVYTSVFENFEVDDLDTWKIVDKILEEKLYE